MPIISVPTFYLTRDITGSLSDNLITNERHTVQDLPFRIIVPNFGGFYVDDLIVNSINTTTNVSTLLVKDCGVLTFIPSIFSAHTHKGIVG